MKHLSPLCVSLIAAFALCAELPLSSEVSAPNTIRLGTLKGPSGIGMIYLFEAPPALPGGKRLESVAVASADLMVPKLVSGEYDMAVLPINMAAKLRASGLPIQLAAIVGEGMVSFITSDASVSSLADLRGKEVYVAGQGATPDYLVQKLLKSAGLDPAKDLRLSYSMPYPEMAAALASGKIAYAVLPEPFATVALKANPKLLTPLDLGSLWTAATGQKSYPMTALVVTNRAAADPEAVRAVLAEKSRKGHTAEIRSLLQKYGADKLSKIDPANYKARLADAEVLKDAT